jgi:aminoglycoside phosphotransferase (APT) family kinase protein
VGGRCTVSCVSEGELQAADVEHVASSVLERPVSVQRHPVGFGNENWIVRETAGEEQWILKVGSLASEAKWRSAHGALALARRAGVPVPELVHDGIHGEHLVRIFTWLHGSPPAGVIETPEQVTTFTSSFARTIRALHAVDTQAFSSRLDGSARQYETWDAYLLARLGDVEVRCHAAGAPDRQTVALASRAIAELAGEVGPHARPTVCHRDLHGGNLLVDSTGHLVGIIDWDAAESWDPAGEWFKLDWILAPELGVDRLDLTDYFDDSAPPPAWELRVRVVHLIESLNTIPNAVTRGDSEFARRGCLRLEQLLTAE